MFRITANSKHLNSTSVTLSNPGVSYQNTLYLDGFVNWLKGVSSVSGVSNGVIVSIAKEFEPMRVITC